MAQARRVFTDLTNHAINSDNVLTGRNNLKVCDALKCEAPSYCSPSCTTDGDFRILEDTTPYQHKCDKLIDVSGFEADPVLPPPAFETPQKVHPSQTPQKVLQPDVPALLGCRDPTLKKHEVAGCTISKRMEPDVPESVVDCATDLRNLWEASVRSGRRSLGCLLQKFGGLGPPPLKEALCRPPMGAPPPPHAEFWPQRHREKPNECLSAPSKLPEEPLPTIERSLASRRSQHDAIELRSESAFEGLVEKILRSSHLQSEHRRPRAEAVLKQFPAIDRENILMWLFQVCAAVGFDDSVLYMTVQLLDRYCTEVSEPIAPSQLQLVTVATISISLKMNGAVDDNSRPPKLQDVLVHIGQHQHSIKDIFTMELQVLRVLGFAVAMPTAADLLSTFLIPNCLSAHYDPVRCVAEFLLQLSLLDAPLHYRYPHAVLAAGALYVALWCTQRGPEHVLALLEDVGSCFDKAEPLVSCEDPKFADSKCGTSANYVQPGSDGRLYEAI